MNYRPLFNVCVKAFLLSICLLGLQISLSSQDCPVGSISFTLQSEVDSFKIKYPNCQELSILQLSGDDITNVDSLINLKKIDGFLSIDNCGNLNDLSGFNQLDSIFSSLRIINNTGLENLNGFDNLKYIESDLNVRDNIGMKSVQGFDALAFIGQDFWISDNPGLESISGFENLASIEGFVWINFNDNLKSIDGISSLESVGDYFRITFNDVLESVTAFSQLKTVENYFQFSYNKKVTNLNSLAALTAISEEFALTSNDLLSDISGLKNVDFSNVNTFEMKYNDELAICNYNNICSVLERTDVDLDIIGNASGCEDLEEVISSCNTSSAEDLFTTFGVTVYPNPFMDKIQIKGVNTETLDHIKIYNLLGQEVMEVQPTRSIDTAHLSKGTYILSFQKGKNLESMVITKQ